MQFESAVRALRDAEVEFVIIGGVAATFHGSISVTFDLDICYSRQATNLLRLVKALAPFHPRLRGIPDNLPFIWDASTLRNGSLFTLKTDIGDIDLLGEVTGLGGYAEVKAEAIEVEAYGGHVSTLNLRGLIRAKRAAGRPKDLLVLSELESLLEAEEP
jgi:predicted nucleotidyltransferase